MPTAHTSPAGESAPLYDFSVLRALRKREALTLGQVAERSGVSVAGISKLERNQSSAELETLYRLARVFGMSAAELLGLAEARMAHEVKAEGYEHDGFKFSRINYGKARVFYGRAVKGSRITRPEMHHDDFETCWVLKGKIKINLPSETRIVKSGRALQFDAILEHSYEALEDSELVLVHLRKENRF
ncbi:helix-turn-helix domain-containing protein [Ruficoccus sp. ZRK36]|uniref:helix-turn-helix domain-containing protein n=1 Tax=Ruficoccus sp. ZRK36 TaxID=2866311 RepID=UPI001C72CA81|nr:helix-turn-helix domain-containing protein [Ruficoccus sp. ZRK36]QYY36792.1 helix-turn-helix domain-containing protein [Ruficoccus sp. ZRK36]